jgi:aspartate/methionine/tyrosine aminotransferase
MRQTTKGQMDFKANPCLSQVNGYSLRGNPVVPLIKSMGSRILAEGPISAEWGGKKREISQIMPLTIGDLFLPGGSRVPKLMQRTAKLAWNGYYPNYSESAGYAKACEAVALYYQRQYGVEIPLHRINLGEGVTGLMQPIGKMFSDPTGKTKPNFITGAIGYPPWVGTLLMYDINPKFAPVDLVHAPQITGDMFDPQTRFVLLYSVDNPGGMCAGRENAESAAEAIAQAQKKSGHAIFLVVDDAYEQLIPDSKRVNFFEIAKKHGIPLMLLSGFDKPVSTGAHGGWMVAWIPPEMEKVGEKFDDALASINSEYLGTNATTQIQMMVYNLVRAGMRGYEIRKWMLDMPANAPARKREGHAFENVLEKHVYKTGKMLKEISQNLSQSWEWSDSVWKLLEGNERLIGLPGRKPDIPYYLFLKLESGPWKNSSDFAVDLANNTGIGVTPGEPFIARESVSQYGPHFRIAVTKDPTMSLLDGSGNSGNFANILLEFASARSKGR